VGQSRQETILAVKYGNWSYHPVRAYINTVYWLDYRVAHVGIGTRSVDTFFREV